MLSWFRRRAERQETATELYGVVVARAREPAFYARMGIPDTPEGRYEMVALHLVLALERLRAEGPAGVELSRGVIETFVADMDGSMREMGVGDLTVPKKVKAAAAGLYARAEAFRAGLARDAASGAPVSDAIVTDALASAIGRFTLVGAPGNGHAAAFAEYFRDATASLAALDSTEILAGRIVFPPIADGDPDQGAGR